LIGRNRPAIGLPHRLTHGPLATISRPCGPVRTPRDTQGVSLGGRQRRGQPACCKVTGTCIPAQETAASIARMMIGEDLPNYRASKPHAAGKVRLEVENLSLPTTNPFGTALSDIRLLLRGGEVLGIAGVSGNRQHELMQVRSGERRPGTGSIRLDSKEVGHIGPGKRRELGPCSVPEDRLGAPAKSRRVRSSASLLGARHDAPAGRQRYGCPVELRGENLG
jgi:ABC-type uncharacterized transport system ATPase subunit